MKKLLISAFSIFVLFCNQIQAQGTNNCSQAMNNFQFNQRKAPIANQYSDNQKLVMAKQLLNGNCFSSQQIKEIAVLFTDEFNRLEFAKEAYSRTIDQGNFYEVYNAFKYFSTVFMLHDHVLEMRKENTNNNPNDNNNNNPQNIVFPNLNYPSSHVYNGRKGCNYPVSENDFIQMAKEINAINNENDRINRLFQIVNQYCFITTHTMKLASLLTMENNRLEFLKRAYDKTYDMDNYSYAGQLFNYQPYKDDLSNYVLTRNNQYNTPVDPVTPVEQICVVNDQEFAGIKQRISKESFDDNKKNLTKSIMKSKKCFSVNQVKEIVGLFAFSSSKMEMAKFAYDYTSDQDNYYQVTDAFNFSSDKEELLKFLRSKGK